MSATDAKPVPQKNVAYRHYLEFRDNTGALVTTVTGADTEISKDGAAFADATNEFTEIGTSGPGYVDFTAAEMNADAVYIKSTCTNANARPYSAVIYPEETGDIRVNVSAWNGAPLDFSAAGVAPHLGIARMGTAQAATANTVTMDAAAAFGDNTIKGMVAVFGSTQGYWQIGNAASNVGATDVITMSGNWPVTPTGTIYFIVFAAAESDAVGIRAAVGLASANLDTQLSAIDDFLDTEVAAIKAKTDTLPASPANEATLTTIANYIDTEVAAIKAKTDFLPSVAPGAAGGLPTVNASNEIAGIQGVTESDIAAIKAKTDQLTFTQTGHVDANIQRINDVTVNGAGVPGSNPWQP